MRAIFMVGLLAWTWAVVMPCLWVYGRYEVHP